MNDLGSLVQQTADRLAGQQVGAVVAGLARGAVEIRGAGRTGPGAAGGPPGPDTLFEIGSVTKVFTSLALARLTLAGTVTLDDPLAEVLADALPSGVTVPAKGPEPLALRHLATHTSGLPRLPSGMLLSSLLSPNKPDPYAHCTAQSLLNGLGRTRLRAAPGRSFRYSNLGAGLLGLALAHRAGVGYGELVRREICEPLGLKDTVLEPSPEQTARLAPGHTTRGRPVPAWHLADLAGAGGLRSTAADLAVLLRAQLAAAPEASGAGTTVSAAPEASGEALATSVAASERSGEAAPSTVLAPAIALTREVRHRVNPVAWMHLGWLGHRLHDRQGGHLQIWHNGGTGGYRSFVAFDPERQVGVIVLANTRRSVDAPGVRLLRTLQTTRATFPGR
ncbi:CubicO group peptidase, beta-lactamase class C family [Streptomyces sp. TLI_053]|uniref:serine hydrolase domain-containing protein n=1 Tax=Streptomyces sp. TLI_053 TaxID=1855352 RepID=UPI00087C83ED|nr:serine hydrolase domain-containing protein [Streptomyces sp. TLI_053]SDT81221.1 CubicO group peptidase, beta-lactamase class C family [Streptomyces sp. TLI_053]